MSKHKVFFFFQAEDGIRDGHVTGVQTCALPIFNICDVHPYSYFTIIRGCDTDFAELNLQLASSFSGTATIGYRFVGAGAHVVAHRETHGDQTAFIDIQDVASGRSKDIYQITLNKREQRRSEERRVGQESRK